MNTLLVLAPMVGVGIGVATAYGVTHRDKRIHFVDNSELDEELEDLDIEVRHTETCLRCEDELDADDVGAIVREDGEYRPICTKPACLDTYDIE